MEEKTAADVINLDQNSIWLRFAIGGVEFEVEAYEASDMLADIDTRHATDPHTCLKCLKTFVVPKEDYGDIEKYNCPGCGQRHTDEDGPTSKIKVSQVFLDDVVALLKSRFGVNRCARSEAAQFYNAVTSNVEAAKKNLERSLMSLSGSESTSQAGLNPSDAP